MKSIFLVLFLCLSTTFFSCERCKKLDNFINNEIYRISHELYNADKEIDVIFIEGKLYEIYKIIDQFNVTRPQ